MPSLRKKRDSEKGVGERRKLREPGTLSGRPRRKTKSPINGGVERGLAYEEGHLIEKKG